MKLVALERIISGGQTGIDQLRLEVARSLGILTGGVAPKGYVTEDGPNSLLRDRYGLTEHISSDYPPRTKANVQQSDGTVLFGKMTGGTKLTVDACEKAGKLYITNPATDELRAWLIEHQIKVLNVAGSRGSKLKADEINQYRKVLADALGTGDRLSMLFEGGQNPDSVGLRGDPYLWAEMAERAREFVLPATNHQLHNLINLLFKELTGESLTKGKDIRVPRFYNERTGGMSTGMVNCDYWINEGIPLLGSGWPTRGAGRKIGFNVIYENTF